MYKGKLWGASFFIAMMCLPVPAAHAACSPETAVSGPVIRAFQRAKSCCGDFRDFQYKDIGFGFFSGKTATFRLGTSAFVFSTGKSYFSAYRLPEFQAPYFIRVDSRPGEAHAPLFYPVVLMLDRNYQIIASTDESTMHDTGKSAIGAMIPVRSADAKYFIVMTTEKALNQCSKLRYRTGTQYGDFTTSLLYSHSPMGKVTLRLIRP